MVWEAFQGERCARISWGYCATTDPYQAVERRGDRSKSTGSFHGGDTHSGDETDFRIHELIDKECSSAMFWDFVKNGEVEQVKANTDLG